MKIAIITPEYPPKWGGIGTYVYYLSNALSKAGNEIHIITRKENIKRESNPQSNIYIYEVPWVYAPVLFSTSFSKNAVLKLIQINIDFDIVFLQCPYVSVSSKLFTLIKSPVISIMHGTWKGERKALKIDGNLLQSPSDISMLLTSHLLEKYEKIAMRKSAGIITISKYCAEELLHYGVQNKIIAGKLEIISNGVDSKIFHPAKDDSEKEEIRTKFGVKPNEFMLLFVGRLVARKGVNVLPDAMANLVISKGISNVKLYIVGKGPLEKRLIVQAKRLGIYGKLNIMEISGSEELAQIYAASDIFVFPSYYEGFGIVILEAMACGIPAISSNISAIPEVVINNKTGCLVEPGNSNDLALKIEYLIKNKDLCIKMGKESRITVLAKYDWDIIARSTIAIFNKVVIESKSKLGK